MLQYLVSEQGPEHRDNGRDELLGIAGVTLAALVLTLSFLFACFSSAAHSANGAKASLLPLPTVHHSNHDRSR